MEVAMPPSNRPTISTEKLEECCKERQYFNGTKDRQNVDNNTITGGVDPIHNEPGLAQENNLISRFLQQFKKKKI